MEVALVPRDFRNVEMPHCGGYGGERNTYPTDRKEDEEKMQILMRIPQNIQTSKVKEPYTSKVSKNMVEGEYCSSDESSMTYDMILIILINSIWDMT